MTKLDNSKSWRNESLLPRHASEGWAIWKGGGKVECQNVQEVTRLIKGWNPTNSTLVGAPGRSNFLPPTAIADFQTSIVSKIRGQGLASAIAVALFGILCVALSLYRPEKSVMPVAVFAWFFAGLVGYDSYFNLCNPVAVTNRALYFFWLTHNARSRQGFFTFGALMVASGIIQMYLDESIGIDGAVEQYGFVYERVRAGEIWRVVAGPFFHGNLVHFLNNSVLLVFLGAILWPTLRYGALVVFQSGVSLGALAEMMLGAAQNEAVFGVSGGVFALFGFAIAISWRNKFFFPEGMAIQVSGICVLTAIGAALFSVNSSSLAHIAGFFVGVLCALFVWVPSGSSRAL